MLLVSQHHGRGERSRWHHSRFRFETIQAAVDAARPGDWILIAPGDYHERGDYTTHRPSDEAGAGVLITTPKIHLRGLDRNGVVVDGTKPGSPRCSSAAADQDFGPQGPDGTPRGRNGVEAFEASGVSIDNLSVCNFLERGRTAAATRSGGTAATAPARSTWGPYSWLRTCRRRTTYYASGQPERRLAPYGTVSNPRGPAS